MKLSVLICTLHSRAEQYLALLRSLQQQLEQLGSAADEVEVLTHVDGGELTVGRKRNELLARSNSIYSCFVDDDDELSQQYLAAVLAALENQPDCVGLHARVLGPSGQPDYRLLVARRPPPGTACVRRACHLNPVRTKVARQVGFADMTSGEDCDYSVKLLPLLRTEVIADERALYTYKLDPATSQTYHASRPGVLYWNRFGGNFNLSMTMTFARQVEQTVTINGMSASTPVSLRGQSQLVFSRHGEEVLVGFHGLSPFARAVIPVDKTADVAIHDGPHRQLRGCASCVVGGRPVTLRYKRKL